MQRWPHLKLELVITDDAEVVDLFKIESEQQFAIDAEEM